MSRAPGQDERAAMISRLASALREATESMHLNYHWLGSKDDDYRPSDYRRCPNPLCAENRALILEARRLVRKRPGERGEQ